MCKYISRKNEDKIIFLDIHGGSATIQTRSKSRLTKGFNILKVHNNILYILSITIGEGDELHKIYKIKSSEEILSRVDTSLYGYNGEILLSVIGDKMPAPCSVADSLNAILTNFATLPGNCDVVVKRVREYNDKVITKLLPLVAEKRDKYGHVYYPYNGGNYRDILEYAIKAGEIVEFKEGNFSNIRKKKR